VKIIPSLVIFRTLELPESAMKIFPDVSTVRPDGLFNKAEEAALPSPIKPPVVPVFDTADIDKESTRNDYKYL